MTLSITNGIGFTDINTDLGFTNNSQIYTWVATGASLTGYLSRSV